MKKEKVSIKAGDIVDCLYSDRYVCTYANCFIRR